MQTEKSRKGQMKCLIKPKTMKGKKSKEKRDSQKEKSKTHIEIWLSNIPVATHSAKEIIDEYRNRWGIEVFFKEEKSYWYLNTIISS
jgi:hypothetical protein